MACCSGLDPSITSFDHWVEYNRPYCRTRRFHSLLRELNGTANVPEQILASLHGKIEHMTHLEVRTLLSSLGGQFASHQHRVCSILAGLGCHSNPISQVDMDKMCQTFGILDHWLAHHGVKSSFTLLLPVVLHAHGLSHKFLCCKPVSALIRRKYLHHVVRAIAECDSELPRAIHPLPPFVTGSEGE